MTEQKRAAMQAAYDWMTSHGGAVFSGGGMPALSSMNAAALGLRQALAAPALPAPALPLTTPVTDDEIDAALDACELIGEVISVQEMRRALEGFVAGRATGTAAYDQQALELCTVCGWKTLIPGDGCLNCERQAGAPAVRRPMNSTEMAQMLDGMSLYCSTTAAAIVRATENHHDISGASS